MVRIRKTSVGGMWYGQSARQEQAYAFTASARSRQSAVPPESALQGSSDYDYDRLYHLPPSTFPSRVTFFYLLSKHPKRTTVDNTIILRRQTPLRSPSSSWATCLRLSHFERSSNRLGSQLRCRRHLQTHSMWV